MSGGLDLVLYNRKVKQKTINPTHAVLVKSDLFQFWPYKNTRETGQGIYKPHTDFKQMLPISSDLGKGLIVCSTAKIQIFSIPNSPSSLTQGGGEKLYSETAQTAVPASGPLVAASRFDVLPPPRARGAGTGGSKSVRRREPGAPGARPTGSVSASLDLPHVQPFVAGCGEYWGREGEGRNTEIKHNSGAETSTNDTPSELSYSFRVL